VSPEFGNSAEFGLSHLANRRYEIQQVNQLHAFGPGRSKAAPIIEELAYKNE